MRTLTKIINEIFDEDFHGHPSREDTHDIDQLKKAVLLIAEEIDNHYYFYHENP